jgi:hypothetical protein
MARKRRARPRPKSAPSAERATAQPGRAAARPEREPDASPVAEPSGFPAVFELLMAVGLGLVVVGRPFRDGATYEYDNFYFLAVIAALFAVWGVRFLWRGGNLRFERPLGLFALFLLVAGLTGLGAIYAELTIRGLLIWTGHFLLFFLVVNALRSRRAVGILLAFFVVAVAAEVVYALVHYHYTLPFVREQMIKNPALIAVAVGPERSSPEFIHRLNANRAFGSFLFANALAAFLVLGIPYLVGEAANSLWRFRRARADGESEPLPAEATQSDGLVTPDTMPRLLAAGAGLLFWILTLGHAYFYYPYVQEMTEGRLYSWSAHLGAAVFWLLVLPAAVASVPIVLMTRYGARAGWHATLALVLPVTLAGALLVLWLTFSRGGMLALIAAGMAALLLLWWGRGRGARDAVAGRAVAGAAAALLVVSALWSTSVHAQGPAAPPAAPAEAQPAPPPGPAIVVEGVDYTMQDLANPTTFWMRLAYWRNALRVIASNFLTGIGLSNFEVVYAQYQAPGEPPVKAAHNDYLQIFAETGILGILAFLAFWGYFLVWGARRILREPQAGERWALLGLYTGVLAFLIHSVVDFNFYNPSLAALQVAMAGAFFARSGALPDAALRRRPQQAVVVILLVAAALAAGTGFRVLRAHALVGDDKDVNARVALANTLFRLDPAQYNPREPFQTTYQTLFELVPDRKTIESFASVYVPREGTGVYRPLNPDEELDPLTRPAAVAIIRNLPVAKRSVYEGAEKQIVTLERAHDVYPYDAKTAALLVQWHDLLREHAFTEAARRKHVEGMLRWSEEAVERNPHSPWYRGFHGNALLRKGLLETSDNSRRMGYFRRALDEYKAATELFPSNVDVWKEYAAKLEQYADAQAALKRTAEAERLRAEARAARARAERLLNPEG